jgi:hypothetical protein
MVDTDITALRLQLRKAGFHPLPLEGKAPHMQGWQQKFNTNGDEIRLWPKTYHLAHNTGVLAKFTPGLDIDITDEDAAYAVEVLAREHFEEHGDIHMRYGNPPKRLIPLRTDEPFTKLSRVFVAPNGAEQKIEVLGDGQQYVVDGIHPNTHKPYGWFGGDLKTIKREDLPYVRREDMERFLNAAAELLVKEFGYVERGSNGSARELPHIDGAPALAPANGTDAAPSWTLAEDARLRSALGAIPANEKVLTEEFGDSHKTWVKIGLALERLDWGEHGYAIWRDWCSQNGVKFDEKGLRKNWAYFARNRNSHSKPVTVATIYYYAKLLGWSGLEKIGQQDGPPDPSAATNDATPLIKTSAEFVAGFVPPEYVVVGLLQRRFLYSNTGQTGAGKTAVTLRLAASAAMGITFAGHETKKVRVLYAAAENPDDVRMRWIALSQHMGFDINTIEVYFTQERFKISQMKDKLRAEAENFGGEFGLVIIDTSPAFFEGDDENSRAQMGAHALLLRSLIEVIPGGPCVIANCHPVKNADEKSLLPAGGGTFVNEVDGNITCAKNDSVTELHWFRKFRGPEFAPMNFLIKTVTHQDLKDSDGRLIPTVICEYLTENAKEEIATAKRKDEDEVLRMIESGLATSYRTIATAMGWKLHSGEPNKTKAERCVNNLKRGKLLTDTRSGRWKITPEGTKALKGEE